MPETMGVEETVRNGEPGFVLEQKYRGISPRAVKGRARARLSAKYPLRSGKIEIVNDPGKRSYDKSNKIRLKIFIPFSGIEDNRGTELLKQLADKVSQ